MRWIRTIIRRIMISAIREDAIKRVDATGLPGETFTDREMMQHYGFASSPQNGAEGVLIGNGNVFYLIAEDDRRYRISLVQGEVALYTDEGVKIHLQRGKKVEVSGADEINLGGIQSTLKKLADERVVDAINAATFGGHGIDVPLVAANMTTTTTRAK